MKRIASVLLFTLVAASLFAVDSYLGGSFGLGYGFTKSELTVAGTETDETNHTFTSDPTAKGGHFFGDVGVEYFLSGNTLFLKFDDSWDYDNDTYDYETNIDVGIYMSYRKKLTENSGLILSVGPSFDYFESKVDMTLKSYYIKIGASAKIYRQLLTHLMVMYGVDVSTPVWADAEVKISGNKKDTSLKVYGIHVSPFIGAAFTY